MGKLMIYASERSEVYIDVYSRHALESHKVDENSSDSLFRELIFYQLYVSNGSCMTRFSLLRDMNLRVCMPWILAINSVRMAICGEPQRQHMNYIYTWIFDN